MDKKQAWRPSFSEHGVCLIDINQALFSLIDRYGSSEMFSDEQGLTVS